MSQDRFETIVALCESMAWAPNSEEVYQRLVDVSAAFLESDEAHLHLLDADGKNFTRHAFHGTRAVVERGEEEISVTVGRSDWLLKSGNLIVMSDYEHPDPEDVIPETAAAMGFKSAVSIPLATPQGVVGMLSLIYKRSLPWTEDDYSYLTDIGRVLGVMVQRVQMTKKDLELEILRERKRLSVEIHDNLSQMVSSLAMRSDTALMCYEEGDHRAAQQELERLGEVARTITKVLRGEMLSLRSPVDVTDGLVESVGEQLRRFQEQWGIRAELKLLSEGPFEVAVHTALQLTRILNECLSNVLRHARASEVRVELKEDGSRLRLTVRDNGRGFDVASVPPERLGIRIMQERALAARGSLRIESDGHGTAVHVEVARG